MLFKAAQHPVLQQAILWQKAMVHYRVCPWETNTGCREAKFLDIENIFHLTQAITLSGPYAKPMKCFLLWEIPAG